MSIRDKLSKFITVSEDEYYDVPENERYEEYREEDQENYEPVPRFNPRSFRENKNNNDNKVVSINNSSKLQVVLTKPKTMEEARVIADSVKEKKAVVVNLESVNGETCRRVLDFLSGVTYATNATMRQVANGTFMITPANVDVNGDVISELGNNGFVID